MATLGQWLAGTRPRTLTASVVPVLAGAALAVEAAGDGWSGGGELSLSRFLLALGMAVALQVGVNFSNDYSDGIRGSDRDRQGPLRLVGSGVAQPRQVLAAAWLCFAAAGGIAVVLAVWVGWIVLPIMAVAIAAAWFYTGGPHPYGYYALGEVSVLAFFGLLPTAGTTYLLTEEINAGAVVAGVGIGLAACALLAANNLRDVRSDLEARKFTLAVMLTRWASDARVGEVWARRMYPAFWIGAAAVVVVLAAVAAGPGRPWALLGLLAPLLAVRLCVVVLRAPLLMGAETTADQTAASTGALLKVLGATGKLLLLYGVTLALGIWLSHLVAVTS